MEPTQEDEGYEAFKREKVAAIEAEIASVMAGKLSRRELAMELAIARVTLKDSQGFLKDYKALTEEMTAALAHAVRKIDVQSDTVHMAFRAGGSALVSSAGKKGANKRHAPSRELKEWARQESAKMRGTHMDIAKNLSQRVPQHLATVSTDPKRFIYDTVRQQRKQTAPKAARGFVPLTRSRQP